MVSPAARESSQSSNSVRSTTRSKGSSKKNRSDATGAITRAREHEKQAKDSSPMRHVVRVPVNETLFSAEQELPRNIEFDHLLGMTTALLISFLVEEAFFCVYPNASVIPSQIQWFGALIIAMSIVELAQISVSISSLKVCLICGVIGFVLSLAIIANGDSTSFLLLGSAFDNVRSYCEYILTERFSYAKSDGSGLASRFTVCAQIACALVTGLISSCLVAPARKFATIDFDLYKRYRQDDADVQYDPYAKPRPNHWSILAITLDHCLPLVALSSFASGRSRDPNVAYSGTYLILLIATFALRVILARVRLQCYLDGAISAFPDFWKERRGNERDTMQAEQKLRIKIVSTYYFLPTIGCLYVSAPLMGLMWTLWAKRSGNVPFGLCGMPVALPEYSLHIACREIFSFFAWFSLAVYTFFSIMSLAVNMLLYSIDRTNEQSTPVPQLSTSGSQRRRLRRMQSSGHG